VHYTSQRLGTARLARFTRQKAGITTVQHVIPEKNISEPHTNGPDSCMIRIVRA